MAESRCLLLFTKPASPGRVKTRLIGELSAAQAAELHQAFFDDLSDRLAAGDFALRLVWALEPGEPLPAARVPSLRQAQGDLGERLYAALAAAAREFETVAAVGSDHPELPLAAVHEAFEALERGVDLALGPAADGGYYLVGSRAASLRPELFSGIPWSTGRVLETTLERCRRLGLDVHLLPGGADVDTPDDLLRLGRHLADSVLDCPNTRALLASWSRLAGV